MSKRVIGVPSTQLGLDERWVLVIEYDQVTELCEHLGISDARDEITGAFVLVGDGDFDCVYLTDSSKPWSIYSNWYDVLYWVDETEDELFLQD